MSMWHKIIAYAESKIRKEAGGCQCKCPNCNTWSPLMNGPHQHKYETTQTQYDYMTCGQCGYKSEWIGVGMIPMLSEREKTRLRDLNNDTE